MKRASLIIENNKIIFYEGELHEIATLKTKVNEFIGKEIKDVFDEEIQLKITTVDTSGYFDFHNDKYIYKTKKVSDSKYIFIDLEGETDENISFYTMLIHEIKNPLAAIRTLVEALSMDILEELTNSSKESVANAQDYFSRITSEIDRLNRLLTSVKYISKHVIPLYVSFDLLKVADHTLKIFGNNFKEKNIEVIRDYSHDVVMYYGDPDQFHQIFNNLISNAIEAIKDPKGTITIKIKENEDSSISVDVLDQGVGIEKGDLGQLFRAFYTKKIGGMGIGLSVVRMIVRSYKGYLSIDSQPGKGTKVSLSFPPKQLIKDSLSHITKEFNG